jgi:hemolysin activation/secretion protein
VSVEKAVPIHGPVLAAITKVELMALFTNEPTPPLSELFLLGGPGSIRGYRTDQFAAVRAAIGSLELHLRGKQGYLLVFADAGYMYSPLGEDKIDESTNCGYGTGFRLIDRDRLVEVALGWNPDLRLNRPQLILRLATGL